MYWGVFFGWIGNGKQGDNDIWQLEKNNKKVAKVLGVDKSQLHTRETSAKTKVTV